MGQTCMGLRHDARLDIDIGTGESGFEALPGMILGLLWHILSTYVSSDIGYRTAGG